MPAHGLPTPGLISRGVGDVQFLAPGPLATSCFGGHSLRSGFITEGGRQGVALPALMALTEHRSVAQASGYFQAGSAPNNPAARSLEDK